MPLAELMDSNDREFWRHNTSGKSLLANANMAIQIISMARDVTSITTDDLRTLIETLET